VYPSFTSNASEEKLTFLGTRGVGDSNAPWVGVADGDGYGEHATVAVEVGVKVGVFVGVFVGVNVGVFTGVNVAVGVAVGGFPSKIAVSEIGPFITTVAKPFGPLYDPFPWPIQNQKFRKLPGALRARI